MLHALKTTSCNCCNTLVMFDNIFPVETNPPFYCYICHGLYCESCFEDHIADEWLIKSKVVAS